VKPVSDERAATMIDVAFALDGNTLPCDHRYALAEAVEGALPWLAGLPGAGVHHLNLVHGTGREAMLSRRTRLTLRVPRECADDACALAGVELNVAGRRLRAGAAQRRELLRHGTLYAHFVAADGADELIFLVAVKEELTALGVQCRPICGRRQVGEGGLLMGFSLMLDALSPDHSLRMLEAGLGRHRRLGCGLFVPHRSAAAVGTPS
jgi:CRISPR-associated protein Cas6